MDNTLENKAKFFAKHYKGRCIVNRGTYNQKEGTIQEINADILKSVELEGFIRKSSRRSVLVKPLSAISDEIAIEACRVLHPLSFTTSAKWFVDRDDEELGLGIITVKSKQSHHSFDVDYSDGTITMYQDDHKSDNSVDNFGVCDFWRREGFLIDFNGKSKEEILTYGWAVLEQEVSNG